MRIPKVAHTPDPRAIASYLAFQYVPHPLSAFAGVQTLPPASTLMVTADGATDRRYWELDYADSDAPATQDELAERLRELLWEATRIRLMSEVPLGAFLSGGIDSSAVVTAMADQTPSPANTVSIGIPDAAFDELRFARGVAQRFSTVHHGTARGTTRQRDYAEASATTRVFCGSLGHPKLLSREDDIASRHGGTERRRIRQELRRIPAVGTRRPRSRPQLTAEIAAGIAPELAQPLGQDDEKQQSSPHAASRPRAGHGTSRSRRLRDVGVSELHAKKRAAA